MNMRHEDERNKHGVFLRRRPLFLLESQLTVARYGQRRRHGLQVNAACTRANAEPLQRLKPNLTNKREHARALRAREHVTHAK
jgi:hypothetical protein